MASEHDREIARRLAAAADERARATAGRADVEALVRRGLRQRLAHRASLVAAVVAAFAVLTVSVLQADPRATRIPDGGFASDPSPSVTTSPAPAAPVPTPSPTATPDEDQQPPASRPTPAPPLEEDFRCEPERSIRIPAGIRVELEASETAFARGEEVRLDLTVTNTGSRPVRYEHSGQRYDFWLEDEHGAIWVWSAGGAFVQPLIVDEIQPGEQRTASESWDGSTKACGGDAGSFGPNTSGLGRPPPGRYVARALWLTIEGGWWSNPVEIVVL